MVKGSGLAEAKSRRVRQCVHGLWPERQRARGDPTARLTPKGEWRLVKGEGTVSGQGPGAGPGYGRQLVWSREARRRPAPDPLLTGHHHPGFWRAPPRAQPAISSHQAQGYSHPGKMFGRGATPIVDPVMPERPPSPRGRREGTRRAPRLRHSFIPCQP